MASELPPISQLGHPVLRKVASPVQLPVSQETCSLVQTLLQVMEQDNGVGIAAPQIGRSQQVIIIASRPNLRYPNAPSIEPLAMINPTIVSRSDSVELGWEGCLSVPSIRGQVERATSIEVQYNDLENHSHQAIFHGFVARIIQHEYDHLIGKVFLDRVASTEHLMSETEFFRQVI